MSGRAAVAARRSWSSSTHSGRGSPARRCRRRRSRWAPWRPRPRSPGGVPVSDAPSPRRSRTRPPGGRPTASAPARSTAPAKPSRRRAPAGPPARCAPRPSPAVRLALQQVTGGQAAHRLLQGIVVPLDPVRSSSFPALAPSASSTFPRSPRIPASGPRAPPRPRRTWSPASRPGRRTPGPDPHPAARPGPARASPRPARPGPPARARPPPPASSTSSASSGLSRAACRSTGRSAPTDSDTFPAASAAITFGWVPTRPAQVVYPTAAPRVMRAGGSARPGRCSWRHRRSPARQ